MPLGELLPGWHKPEDQSPKRDTGGYSKARIRLPEGLLKRLLGKTATGLEDQVEPQDLWCGRHVRICDGSSVLMSDTRENQAVYPQHSNQAPGCGFPIAKVVVMFSAGFGGGHGNANCSLQDQ